MRAGTPISPSGVTRCLLPTSPLGGVSVILSLLISIMGVSELQFLLSTEDSCRSLRISSGPVSPASAALGGVGCSLSLHFLLFPESCSGADINHQGRCPTNRRKFIFNESQRLKIPLTKISNKPSHVLKLLIFQTKHRTAWGVDGEALKLSGNFC